MTEIDDRPEPCTLPGHVPGCPGRAGGDHEYLRCPHCGSYERARGCMNADCGRWEGPQQRIERLVAFSETLDLSKDEEDEIAREADRRFEQYRDDRIMERYEGRHRG